MISLIKAAFSNFSEKSIAIGLIAFLLSGITSLFLASVFLTFHGLFLSGFYLQTYAIIGVTSFFLCFGQQFRLMKFATSINQAGEPEEIIKRIGKAKNRLSMLLYLHIILFTLVIIFFLTLPILKTVEFSILITISCFLLSQNRLLAHYLIGMNKFPLVAVGQIIRSGALLFCGVLTSITGGKQQFIAYSFLLAEISVLLWQMKNSGWLIKKISIGVFKSEFMQLSKNSHLVLGDITFEFGPKVQVILSSMLASKSQAASVAFMFALIEVVTQMAVVFRNRFNGIMLSAAKGNNEKLVIMKNKIFKFYRIALPTCSLLVFFASIIYLTLSNHNEFFWPDLIGLTFVLLILICSGPIMLYTHSLVLFSKDRKFFFINAMSLAFAIIIWGVLFKTLGYFTAYISYCATVALTLALLAREKRQLGLS